MFGFGAGGQDKLTLPLGQTAASSAPGSPPSPAPGLARLPPRPALPCPPRGVGTEWRGGLPLPGRDPEADGCPVAEAGPGVPAR